MPRRSSAPAPEASSEQTDRYEQLGEIASGGMGAVFRVFDRLAGEQRALKRMRSELIERPSFVASFEREYQVLAGLDHPRIIKVFDYGVDAHGPYYTMELLGGEDLRHAAPLAYREACLYLRDVATSLALLHARRLLHRDLNAGNVRRTPDGHCKLFDFGALASFGHTREIAGTPPAIPPEALADASLDHRSDLYQLGALGYLLLTGRHAYPAAGFEDLTTAWLTPPAPPSALGHDTPPELDLLVLSLLSLNPLARPASAAEVISRLEIIGELAPEHEADAQLFARSFLLKPRFIGRSVQLAAMACHVSEAREGRGNAVLIEAAAGAGRTRLLDEVGMRAQLAGAHVVRVDASVVRHGGGTLRALALRLLDTLPGVAHGAGQNYRVQLLALGPEVKQRLRADAQPGANQPLEGWFAEISRSKPLVIQVDNVEYADDVSLGVLARLASISREHPLFVMVTEQLGGTRPERVGLSALRHQCAVFGLPGLTNVEMLELSRSLFGETPNVERFAEWLQDHTAGSPLHSIETARQLVSRDVIRYAGGMWLLPTERPITELPAALEGALSVRLDALSEPARALAECLSLQRERPTFELCRLLAHSADEPAAGDERLVHGLLDELARNDVLHAGHDGYHFSSTALRETLLAKMDAASRKRSHLRLGQTFATVGDQHDAALRIEAGYHLIRGGDELRGADAITLLACDNVAMRTLFADLHRAGEPLAAALEVQKRNGRSLYLQAPLLAALAQEAFYEDRAWAELYAEEALATLEQLTGLRLARRLARFMGRHLSLLVALSVACGRFYLQPRSERPYSFGALLVQLFSAVTTLSGAATMALDADRAEQLAEVLSPFSVLPERSTPVGIYQYCLALGQTGRDHQAAAFASLDELVRRFENSRYYVGLHSDARRLYVMACHFSRGSLAALRDDGRAALESADALDASGLKLYAMIASFLRFLYFANRAEFVEAAVHREQVELHAAHVGTAWQVELWEPAALLPVYTKLEDVVALTRISEQLLVSSAHARSLALYARLARAALGMILKEPLALNVVPIEAELSRPARSFLGWGSLNAGIARGFNQEGKHELARRSCEEALAQLTTADQTCVAHFLELEIQLARAEAGLGQLAEALHRIDGLLARFLKSQHPLVQGSLHEARAQIAWAAGMEEEYEQSLAKTEQWYRPTGTPALIAKCERLIELASSAPACERGALESARRFGSRPTTGAPSQAGGARQPETPTIRASRSRPPSA